MTDRKRDCERQTQRQTVRHRDMRWGHVLCLYLLRLWRLTEEEPYQLVPVHVGHRGSGIMRHHF